MAQARQSRVQLGPGITRDNEDIRRLAALHPELFEDGNLLWMDLAPEQLQALLQARPVQDEAHASFLARSLKAGAAGAVLWFFLRGRNRYITSQGYGLPPLRLTGGSGVVAARVQARMAALGRQLQTGEISLAQWQRHMESMIRLHHLAQAAAGGGGWLNLGLGDLQRVEAQVRVQLAFLARFVDQIRTGQQLIQTNGFLVRARLYGTAAQNTFQEAVRVSAEAAGAVWERWVLGPADHCEGGRSCPLEAAKGLQRLGVDPRLPPIGSRLCQVNCKCRIVHYDGNGNRI